MTIFDDAKSRAKTSKPARGSKTEVRCNGPDCTKRFMARNADIARGWGRFCSKKCKAWDQEARTGQNAKFKRRQNAVHNYLGSGVDRETYLHYQKEHGGIPQFDRNGNYVGFRMSIGDLAYGGYNNAGPEDPMGDGKW